MCRSTSTPSSFTAERQPVIERAPVAGTNEEPFDEI